MSTGYKISDKLCVREWDDMAEQYGLDILGDINFPSNFSFVKEMKHMCGNDFTIKSVDSIAYGGKIVRRYYSEENIEQSREYGDGYWVITEEMLEPRETLHEITSDELMKVLGYITP